VAGVPRGLGDLVDQQVAQGRVPAFLRPPRDQAPVIERQRLDRGVGVRAYPPVEIRDLLR
jgi:hypothetical protein